MIIRTVLASLYDKRDLDVLIRGFHRLAIHPCFYATGGTHRHLHRLLGTRSERELVAISDYSGRPELPGGLLKSLDYRLFLGILADRTDSHHEAARQAATAVYFDLVVVNLYPFHPTGDPLSARAWIDIGGHALLRAAAKNWPNVMPLCDPNDYEPFLKRLGSGGIDRRYRLALAAKTFEYIARTDHAVADYFGTLPDLGAAEK